MWYDFYFGNINLAIIQDRVEWKETSWGTKGGEKYGGRNVWHTVSRANSLPFSQRNTGLITKHGIILSCVNSACPPPITTFHSPPPPSWITNTRSVEDVGHAAHPGGWCLWCWRWGFWGWWLRSRGISFTCTTQFLLWALIPREKAYFQRESCCCQPHPHVWNDQSS